MIAPPGTHLSLNFRHDKDRKPRSIDPWFTSWFMVSRPGGAVITALRQAVIDLWADPNLSSNRYNDYFWDDGLMAYRPLRRFVQKMAVVSGSQLIDQVRSARNYSSADGLPKRVAKIWIESRN